MNALIIHASGEATQVGPCGNLWESPFGTTLGADAAFEKLRNLPNFFRGKAEVYLNRRGPDGFAPIDVATRFGSVRVATALVAHGARVLLKHVADAKRYGHSALVVYFSTLVQ